MCFCIPIICLYVDRKIQILNKLFDCFQLVCFKVKKKRMSMYKKIAKTNLV